VASGDARIGVGIFWSKSHGSEEEGEEACTTQPERSQEPFGTAQGGAKENGGTDQGQGTQGDDPRESEVCRA
jgi:hypothetical protein